MDLLIIVSVLIMASILIAYAGYRSKIEPETGSSEASTKITIGPEPKKETSNITVIVRNKEGQ